MSDGHIWDFDNRRVSVRPSEISHNECCFTSVAVIGEKINALFSGETKKCSFSPQIQQEGMLFEYGILRHNEKRDAIYHHKSSVKGFSVSSCFSLEWKVGISICCNKGLMSDVISRVALWGLGCLISIASGNRIR